MSSAPVPIISLDAEQFACLVARVMQLASLQTRADLPPFLWDVSEEVFALAGNVATPVLEANAERRGIVFSNSSGGSTWLSTRNDLAASQGMRIDETERPIVLSYELNRSLVTAPWFARSGGSTLWVAELLYHPERMPS